MISTTKFGPQKNYKKFYRFVMVDRIAEIALTLGRTRMITAQYILFKFLQTTYKNALDNVNYLFFSYCTN